MNELSKKFKELRNEAENDCKSIDINSSNNTFNISSLRIKWLNRHYDWLEVSLELEMKRKRKYFDVRINIDETDNRQWTNNELHREVERDKDYRELVKKCEFIVMVCDFCKNVVDSLDKKSWEIKNQLEYMKYTQGH